MPKKKTDLQVTKTIIHDSSHVGFSASRRASQDQQVKTDKKSKTKPGIDLEVTTELCELCRQPVGEDQTCQRCERRVCEKCAETDSTGRYCPPCFNEIKSLSKLA